MEVQPYYASQRRFTLASGWLLQAIWAVPLTDRFWPDFGVRERQRPTRCFR
jgi:hypothetical protein